MAIALPFRLRKTKSNATPTAAEQMDTDEEPRYRPIEWSLVRRLLISLKPYRRIYVVAISVGLVQVLLEMLSPKFISYLIDYGTAYSSHQLPGVSLHGATWHVLDIMGLWVLVFIASVTLQRICLLKMTQAGESVQFDFRRRLFNRLQSLSMSYYDKTKLGRIISRCTSDIDSLREANVWGIWQVVANSLQITVAAGLMLYTDWRLFFAVAWLGVVLFVCNMIYLKKSVYRFQVVREGWTRVSTNMAENITGVRVVTAFDRQDPNLLAYNRLQEINTANNVSVARINGIYQPGLEVIRFAGRVMILLLGGYLVATAAQQSAVNPLLDTHARTVGAVVAVFLYWDFFMNPIIAFGAFYNTLLTAMAGAERVFNLLDTEPDVQDVPRAKPLGRIAGNVRFENVTFGYNPDRPVLHDVSFEAKHGQMIALVGATGSGKSSIVSLIARFYQPQQGRVLVDETDIRYITADSLHKQMGLVLQVNYLFSGTVMDNIRYSVPNAADQQVIDAARAIGTHDAILSLKDEYQSDVGERGANMSLGQRQLICFTRAFLADPRIFMLDEATSAVDTGTEMLVQQSLEKLLAGRTTFVVAHRLSTIKRADCILVISAGKIIERGAHAELLAVGGKYAHLYEQFTRQH